MKSLWNHFNGVFLDLFFALSLGDLLCVSRSQHTPLRSPVSGVQWPRAAGGPRGSRGRRSPRGSRGERASLAQQLLSSSASWGPCVRISQSTVPGATRFPPRALQTVLPHRKLSNCTCENRIYFFLIMCFFKYWPTSVKVFYSIA